MEDPFKAGMAVMKEAAAADAKVKKGDDSMKPEAARLYGEGVGLLQQAIDSPKYNDKVKLALQKRLDAANGRLAGRPGIYWRSPIDFQVIQTIQIMCFV